MLLRQIRYFASVVKLGSFTEAAEENFISQSAISQQIKALEDELGVKLLEREGRKFSPTPAGEYFYRKSLVILDDIQRVCKETVRIANGGEMELRVGSPRGYAGQEIQIAVADFSGRHPGVTLRIVHGNHEELHDLLRFGGTDLVIDSQRRVFSKEYVNYHLAFLGSVAEVACHSPLAALPHVDVEDLKKLPCILISSPAQRQTEESYYRSYLGLEGDLLFAENLEEARLLAAGGRGFLPIEGSGGSASEKKGLRRLPILRDGKQITQNYCAFWSKENSNPYLMEFAETLLGLFPSDGPGRFH